jgi:hypothetical protein
MRSRIHSALLLAMATALLVCGAFMARAAHPDNLLAKPGAPAIQEQYE